MNKITPNFNLTTQEPPAFNQTIGTNPLIILGAHNGWLTPKILDDTSGKPLGLERNWFTPNSPHKRHEICDWGMDALFANISPPLSEAGCTILTANYSRLVCDFNRTPDFWLTTHADELKTPIPGNTNSTKKNKNWRTKTFYNPWFNAVKSAIESAKQRHGYAIVLDLHSFTPTWHGEERKVDVGSIRLSKTKLSETIRHGLKVILDKNGIIFEPDAPYDLRNSPLLKEKFAAKIISKHFKAAYYGLEFKNSLLQKEDSCKIISKALMNTTQQLLNHPNLQSLT